MLAHGAGILPEADVENPVKPVFDALVDANRCRDQLTGTDVVEPLQVRLLLIHLTAGVHQSDRLALGRIRQTYDSFRGRHGSEWADNPTMGRQDRR